MSEVSTPVEKSTWASKFSALGPGIVMASAAVGGSHIIASTQAGAIYGWELVSIVILANLFKYPFFRFGVQYTLDTGNTLLEGYRQKGKFYLWLFLALNVFATVINTAAVGLLTAAILTFYYTNSTTDASIKFISDSCNNRHFIIREISFIR